MKEHYDEVKDMYLDGYSDQAIATKLNISLRSVQRSRRNMQLKRTPGLAKKDDFVVTLGPLREFAICRKWIGS